MRRMMLISLLVAAPLLTLDVKPASACGWGGGYGYGYGYRSYYRPAYRYRPAYAYASFYRPRVHGWRGGGWRGWGWRGGRRW
jgi:hypothetical protein